VRVWIANVTSTPFVEKKLRFHLVKVGMFCTTCSVPIVRRKGRVAIQAGAKVTQVQTNAQVQINVELQASKGNPALLYHSCHCCCGAKYSIGTQQ
jgi:hypothetical protein